MSLVIYGTDRTRITLYDPTTGDPTTRYTLQREDREGLVLSFKEEGVVHALGSGASWARSLVHHGFRPELAIKWAFALGPDHGLAQPTTEETYSGGTWGAPADIHTSLALSRILSGAFKKACLVEPHKDKAWSFLAQPDPGKAFGLSDLKAVAHTKAELSLIGQTLIDLPDWASL